MYIGNQHVVSLYTQTCLKGKGVTHFKKIFFFSVQVFSTKFCYWFLFEFMTCTSTLKSPCRNVEVDGMLGNGLKLYFYVYAAPQGILIFS